VSYGGKKRDIELYDPRKMTFHVNWYRYTCKPHVKYLCINVKIQVVQLYENKYMCHGLFKLHEITTRGNMLLTIIPHVA